MAVNFFVNRLYVLAPEGRVAYDERFHHGVNIIRGANSSGKSTITHLLFYGLGGDYTDFVSEARRCSRVMVEISINDAVYTLSRPIDKDANGRVLTKRDMTIYWGTLDEALQMECPFNTFSYNMSSQRKSFSNQIFELMDMPIVQGDCNITIHQLLRLLYIDQESPTQSLFYFERFDNQTTRETVADLLLGIFDSQLYAVKLRQKALDAELDDVKADIRGLAKTLNTKQRSPQFILSEIEQRNDEINKLSNEIMQLRQGKIAAKPDDKQTVLLKAELRRIEHECDQEEEMIDLLEHDIEDTQMFISELQRKQMALRHSSTTRNILGTLRLEYCPECLSPLTDAPDGTCHLCRQPVDNHVGVTQAKRLISEYSFQIEESNECLRKDKQNLATAQAHLSTLQAQRQRLRQDLDFRLANVQTSVSTQIDDLIYNKGVLRGELQQFYTMLEMARRYEQFTLRKAEIEEEMHTNNDFIKRQTECQKSRRYEVMARIQRHGAYFLNHDEVRQRDFQAAKPIDFNVDFSNNIVYLADRYAKSSASSAFLLKLVARFSLFFASLDIPWMRYPRFIFADNMEDKGIEPGRAKKFQQTLIDALSHYDSDTYQVIYTTSYITPELDHSHYIVGDYYDVDHKSLRNV